MLDDRKAAILRAVVSEYIETAQPVGSQHVTRQSGLAVSPATVRNEMAVLEREGYLTQPHTSAGRIPTDKGYRFFVDHLAAPGPLDPAQRQRVQQFFRGAHGELERMLHDTSRLLADLTDYAAVVVGPPHEAATIRSVQLVSLAPRIVLLVAVLSNGVIEKRTIELGHDAAHDADTDDAHDDARLAAAGAHLAAHLTGRTINDLGTPSTTNDKATDKLVATALKSLAAHEDEGDNVFVGGASRMARAFDAVETVRSILATLEEQFVVVGLLQDVLDSGLSVAIGTEHGFEPLSECAVVVAPYEVEGERAGTIGVLGPTRMNYPQAMAAVAVVSQRLGKRLTEG